jgi:hypothetical protein
MKELFPTGAVALFSCLLYCAQIDSADAVVTPLVDQQIIVPIQSGIAVTAGYSFGQSFTVGLAGSLTRIDFQLGRNAGTSQPLQVELRTATGDLPNLAPSGLLFSGSIAAADVPVLIFTSSFSTSIDLSSTAPSVSPGEKLVVLLSSNDGDWYNWDNSGYFNSNPYPNGTALQLGATPNWAPMEAWDFGFRTWVTPIPEPAGLLTVGLLILALRRWAARPF